MGYNFGNDMARHAPLWKIGTKTLKIKLPDTMWALYEFSDDNVDIIGYFWSQKDARKAKKFWKKKGLQKPGSRLEIHDTTIWGSSKEFKKFWGAGL